MLVTFISVGRTATIVYFSVTIFSILCPASARVVCSIRSLWARLARA